MTHYNILLRVHDAAVPRSLLFALVQPVLLARISTHVYRATLTEARFNYLFGSPSEAPTYPHLPVPLNWRNYIYLLGHETLAA